MSNSLRSKTNPHTTKYPPIIALTLLLAWPSAAWGTLDSIRISPENPSVNDVITVSVFLGYQDSCWELTGDSTYPYNSGVTRVWVKALDSYEEGADCGGDSLFYVLTYQIGPFPVGIHKVFFTEYRTSVRHPGRDHYFYQWNVIPDLCCIGWRGNVDGSDEEHVDIADLIYLVDYAFLGGPWPPCGEEADMNLNQQLDISDVVYFVDYMFTNGPEPPPCGAPDETYSYTGYDSTGAPVVQGTLFFVFDTPSEISGTWELQPVGDTSGIGPQVGSGELEGYVWYGNEWWVNLNPHQFDYNVYLTGVFDGDIFSGTWIFSTFAGETNHGTFMAYRQP